MLDQHSCLEKKKVSSSLKQQVLAETSKYLWYDFDENKTDLNCCLCSHHLCNLSKANANKAGTSSQNLCQEKTAKSALTVNIAYSDTHALDTLPTLVDTVEDN